MRHRTAAVWLLSTLVFTYLAVASVPIAAQESQGETVPRPPLWSGAAVSSGIHLHVNTEPTILPVAEFINLDVPFGTAQWDAGAGGEALASAVWPGTAVTEGPGLLCDFGGGCPFPMPGYPLSAQASTTQPEASTQDGTAHAVVAPEGVSTRAGLSTALAPVLEPLAQVFQVDAVESTTDLRFVDGALVSTATSVLQDVALLDGTIVIEAIRVTTESRSDGEATIASSADIQVSGVTVSGQPATITEDGIQFAGQGDGGEAVTQANAALAGALEDFGADVRLVSSEEAVEQTTARASAGGLIVSFAVELAGEGLPTVPVPGAPLGVDPNVVYRTYVGSVVLGSAGTTAFASTSGFGPGGGGDLGDLSDLAGLGGTANEPSGSGDAGSPAGTEVGSGSFGTPPSLGQDDAPATTTAPANDPPQVAAPTTEGSAASEAGTTTLALAGLSEQAADGLTLVYAFGALASTVMFVATRLHRRAPIG